MVSPHSTEPIKTPKPAQTEKSESSGQAISTGSNSSGSGRRRIPAEPVNGRAGSVGARESNGLLDRDQLLRTAGITPKEQARAVKQAWDKKLELLEATIVKHFAHEGKVTDERVTADNRTQLDAAESVDRMLGVIAPKAEQKVTVTYRLELPDWARPDSGPKVIDVTARESNDYSELPAPGLPTGAIEGSR